MVKIQLICVGSLKEKYWKDAVREYEKRLANYCILSIDEVREGKDKVEEGRNVLARIKPGSFVIALDIKGKEYSSEELSAFINGLGIYGNSHIAMIIGGSTGLSHEVLDAADLSLSFSKLTYPHQMMRVILLEQLYRSFKIIRNETYHK